MIVGKDWYAVCSCCTGDRSGSVEINAAVIERVRQDDRIGMQRRDDVCAGREVLRKDLLYWKSYHLHQTSEHYGLKRSHIFLWGFGLNMNPRLEHFDGSGRRTPSRIWIAR